MVLFFFTSIYGNSQIYLQGFIKSSSNSEPIPFCSVLVKSIDNNIIAYSIANNDGFYTVDLPSKHKKLIIETSIISYLPTIKEIDVSDSNVAAYTLDFELDERLTRLEEVYVASKKTPIKIKKDTTEYDIIQFKNGSERVVEDLLKKLPGITISDNGTIKFKGKQVTTLLLDGDNVFNDNYTIGTKNIDSDIVESVQAIEDYDPNYLLKGVKTSQDVAINLVLKKGMSDISGDIEIGAGLKDKKYLRANAISVSKKLKGFSTLSYNNIGENLSPYNFSSNSLDIAKINEANQRSTNLINKNTFNSVLAENRTLINSNYFASFNALYKFNNKLSLRFNYGLFKDQLKRSETNDTDYTFENNISINTQENFVKNPFINTFDYEFIYKINKKSLFTAIGKIDFQNITSVSNGFNNGIAFENLSKSEDLFFSNKAEYTYKFNNTQVFQFLSNVSTNNVPQNINVFTNLESFNQNIDLKKSVINLETKYLSKIKKTEYTLALGYHYDENFMDSNLNGITIENQFLSNNVYYKLSKIYFNVNYKYNINKWQFSSSLKNELLNVTINDFNLDYASQENTLLFNPTFSINYYLNKTSYLYSSYNISNQIPNISKTYSGLLFINNRTLLNNSFNFNAFNNSSINFGYRINDFYNLFQFNLYTRYGFKKYGYINKLNVNENTDFYTSIVDVTKNKSLNFGLDIEKYVHVLKSTFNINSSYAIQEYQNMVNNSGLRDNTSKTFFGQLDMRTGFKKAMNFNNKLLFNINKFETALSDSNTVTTFQNDFSIKYIKDDFQFTVNSQYFKPDLKSSISGDLFLDTFIFYKPKSNKVEYQFKANNLLNKKVYKNINSNDFSTSIFEHNLIERFVLLSINFKF